MNEGENLSVSYITSTIIDMDKISQSMIGYGVYDWKRRAQIV